jgi:RNA polymerase sigma factor (sigma-70 family)
MQITGASGRRSLAIVIGRQHRAKHPERNSGRRLVPHHRFFGRKLAEQWHHVLPPDQEAQAGDMGAYERLLREITPKLRQMVRKRRQFFTAEEVEDLVQEILLSIHAVRATYDPNRPFMPWLSTIAHNRLIDSARRFYRGKSNEVQMDELPVTFADDWTNIKNEEYRDPEELSIAIKSLPEGHRKAIEMLKLREMSLKEAAAASGTTIGALKISIHRAVLNLRKALNKE